MVGPSGGSGLILQYGRHFRISVKVTPDLGAGRPASATQQGRGAAVGERSQRTFKGPMHNVEHT